jgi:exosome complex component RRP41
MKLSKKSDVKLIENGKRTDGRKVEDIRPVEISLKMLSRADGSAKVSFGKTTAIAGVHGPRELYPKFMQEFDTGIIRCRYNMAPFSVDDRKSPGPDRRSTEISKVMRLALEPALFLEDFPKATVDVFAEIIQADGSTRVTALNAASLALAAAGIPMRDLVTACSVGKAQGQLIVDLNGKEDNYGEADMGYAMIVSKDEVTLLQMDGVLTREEVVKLFQMAKDTCKKIYEMQKGALKESFGAGEE